ncbi:Presenilins-associated rhomboid-like protein, mitochondrial [Lachnellula occidentalis]|uniref:Presenilins-associated rhomboid-like protein, mitochondrial n=1 Tax=Lachnellula occidentalis TaxID=215460 RepID=A0A8H8S7J0_9HELO|nr:Presenilins-associated rhomboid-like protein, mitochondrial [Lachnellula occidentalis]
MNSLGPSISRVACLDTRSFLQTCSKVDGLAARIAQQYARPYSIFSSRCSWRDRKTSVPGRARPILRIPNVDSQIRIGARTFASHRIIKDFTDLPKDYESEDGLTFRAQPISQNEALRIFGKGVDAETANRILRVLHGLRVSGTLEDPNSARLRAPFQDLLIKRGLSWLRKNVPVDEVQNAGLRAEQELEAMNLETVQDSIKIGLWHPNSGEVVKGESPYGKSGLDKIKEVKAKAWDEKEKKLEENRKRQADEIRQNTGTLQTGSASHVELRRPGENKRLQYYLERAQILPDTPPEMSIFQRLFPSGLVVLGTLISAYVFTQVYTPPATSARLWPDIPPSAATVAGIIFLNIGVFAAWRFPPLFRFLNTHFILVPGYPFATSILGNVFSHQSISHLAMNMGILYFVGSRLHDEIGRANFIAVYLSSGAISSFVSLASFVVRGNFVSSSLGASGALCGIIACYLSINSGEKVKILGIFPPDDWPSLSALGMLVFMVGLDVLGLWRKKLNLRTVDHVAHLGGYAAGIGSAQLLMYRFRRRREIERERKKEMGIVDRIREGRM